MGNDSTAPGRLGDPGADSLGIDPAGLLQGLLGSARGELGGQSIDGVAGGGAVRVTMAGDGTVTAVKIAPEAVDPLDLELLEELLVSAFADGQRQVQQIKMQSVGRLAEAFGLGGSLQQQG